MATLEAKQTQIIGGVTWVTESKLRMTVTEENPTYSVKVSEHPIEDGGIITDHIVKEPTDMSIQGVVVGKDAGQKIAKLKKWNQEGMILKYVGRNVVDGCIIESLSTTHTTSVSNGFEFDITLKVIKRAKTKYTTLYGNDPVTLSKYTNSQVGENKSRIVGTKKNVSTDAETFAQKTKSLGAVWK